MAGDVQATGKLGRLQYSLGYLMLEVLWIALAVGFTRYIVLMSRFELFPDEKAIMLGCYVGNFIVIPTAIGGLIGRMRMGAICGFVLLVVVSLYTLDPPFFAVFAVLWSVLLFASRSTAFGAQRWLRLSATEWLVIIAIIACVTRLLLPTHYGYRT